MPDTPVDIIETIIDNTILLGDDADKFFHDDLGKYIIARAKKDIEEAFYKLKDADPNNTKEIQNLLMQIKIAEQVPAWLNDAIIEGRAQLELKLNEEE